MDDYQKIIIKKKIKEIKSYVGEGTQLISLYLPPGSDRSTVTKQLTDEISQSSNIKSQHTRKNVQAALKRITNYLRQIDFKLPEKGLILFSGNVSENPSKTDVILLDLIPPKELKTKLYWCDSSFHTAPLEELLDHDDSYGIIAVDKREATIALITGKTYVILKRSTSAVPGKTRAGGQCLKDCLLQMDDGSIMDIESCNKNMLVSSIYRTKEYVNNYSKITKTWKVNKNKTYKIITKNPRFEVECSQDHVFFVNDFNKFVEKKAQDLTKDDYLIIPELIKTKQTTQKLDVKNNYNTLTISKKGQRIIKKKRLTLKLSQKDLANKLNVSPTTISKVEVGKNIPPFILKKICSVVNLNFFEFIKKYGTKTSFEKVRLPKTLDDHLAKFVGYLIGDGCVEQDRLSFFEQDKELALKYKQKYDSYFNLKSSYRYRETKNYYQLRFTSRPLVRFIKDNFVEVKKALDSRSPSKICKSNNKVVAGFLKGLYDAEGTINKSRKSVDLSVNNKKLAQEVQLLLLRFSIVCSFLEYDNKANIYSNNPRYTLSISEKQSLEIFKKNINFTYIKKTKNLDKIILQKSDTSYSRQILVPGSEVKKIIYKHGCKLSLFPKVSAFFNNKRKISKQIFKKSILNNIKNKKLCLELLKIYNQPVLPVQIKDIKKVNQKSKMIDISVKNKNFLANGVMVHNSAARFERLREKAAESFFKRVGEHVNSAFVGEEKLKGIIVGGPGHTKHDFIDIADIDHRIKDKILGTVDVGYTDESGIKEILDKGADILKDLEIVKEKELVNKFFGEVAKNNLATYGFKEVIEAITLGKVSRILVSEAIDWTILKFKCLSCDKIIPRLVKDKDDVQKTEKEVEQKCDVCGKKTELIEEADFFDFVVDFAKPFGSEIEIVSTETQEGMQFYKAFGGFGAFLRYK